MDLIITGEPKEIAALVLELQGRQGEPTAQNAGLSKSGAVRVAEQINAVAKAYTEALK